MSVHNIINTIVETGYLLWFILVPYTIDYVLHFKMGFMFPHFFYLARQSFSDDCVAPMLIVLNDSRPILF